MTNELLQDLKQFITATVSQQTASLRNDIREDIQEDIGKDLRSIHQRINILETRLEQKIDDLSLSIANTFDDSHELVDEQFKDHERRIVRLERKIA